MTAKMLWMLASIAILAMIINAYGVYALEIKHLAYEPPSHGRSETGAAPHIGRSIVEAKNSSTTNGTGDTRLFQNSTMIPY